MQAFRFIRYFFYLATNWNLRIAWHITKEEIKGEKKYGISSTGVDELKKLGDKGIDISHATVYMPASYDMLEDLFLQLNSNFIHHFIDIGCGKGRVLCVAAYHGIKKLAGVDLSIEFCDEAVKNLEQVKQTFPHLQYTIKNNDAFYYDIPVDADCIFFFNPFDETIMSGVVKNIEISLKNNPREITVVYLNPLNKELFTKIGFKQIYHIKKLNHLEGCIMKRARNRN